MVSENRRRRSPPEAPTGALSPTEPKPARRRLRQNLGVSDVQVNSTSCWSPAGSVNIPGTSNQRVLGRLRLGVPAGPRPQRPAGRRRARACGGSVAEREPGERHVEARPARLSRLEGRRARIAVAVVRTGGVTEATTSRPAAARSWSPAPPNRSTSAATDAPSETRRPRPRRHERVRSIERGVGTRPKPNRRTGARARRPTLDGSAEDGAQIAVRPCAPAGPGKVTGRRPDGVRRSGGDHRRSRNRPFSRLAGRRTAARPWRWWCST